MSKLLLIFSFSVFFSLTLLASEEAPPNINLYFGGDTFVSSQTFSNIKNTQKILKKLDFLKTADFFMVNLETTITENENKTEKKFNFKTTPGFLDFLKSSNVSLVNVANNHIFDYGKEGLIDTLSALDIAGMRYIGAGANLEEAREPQVFELKGKKFAFLSCYGSGWCGAGKNKPGVYPREGKIIFKDIKALKTKTDFVIVNVHWGQEKLEEPEDWQIKLARKMVRSGADCVIGHHSHTVQGMESYKGGIIVYSIGNFFFESGLGRETALVKVKINGGKIEAEYVPIIFGGNLTAKALTGEKKKIFLEKIAEKSRILQELE